MYPWLEDAIERDVTVITASRRLARELASAYAAQKVAAGVRSWVTPSIHALGDWCRQQFDAHTKPDSLPTPIDDFSSSILWDRCLRAHAPEELPAFRGFLKHARDAWQLISEWNVPLTALTAAARSPDERLFATAASDYQALLNSASWLDARGMPRLVAQLLSDKLVAAPQELIFAGFDRFVPAVTDLVDALKAAGCDVQTPPQTDASEHVRIASFEDHDAELRCAGAWARNILQNDPGAKIAIISPDLQSEADRKARLVREGLAPGWQYGHAAYRSAVNVSYGRKLAEFPAIAVALLLLKWLSNGLPTREISLLLRARCLASEVTSGRCRLELVLRRYPDRAWTAADLLRALQGRDDSADSLAWIRGIEAIIALQRDSHREEDPAYWASCFDSLLDAWNWPCNATLSSGEFQLVNRWRDLLNEFARTSIVEPQLRLKKAAERLATLADDVVFQPEADAGLVSLTGILEAAGMNFDHVWVSGLHAGQWPPAGAPSALLSRDVQKEYGMPDATPADTLLFSRRVLKRLAGSAPDVVFSWPESDGDSELAASSLLEEMPHESYSGAADPGWHALDFCGEQSTLAVAEDPVPRVAADENVRGGAYTVQRQMVEPFAAFVYGRLGVKRPDSIEAGIASRVRGDIIHNALHTLLAGRPTRAEIKSWIGDDVEQRLGTAIDAALAEPLRHADATYTRLLGLERQRLFALLRSFIDAEVEREEYAVADVEKSVDFEAFGVRLKLRIDRIDRLVDGSMFIIDYKTGSPRSLLNRDGEPTDMQLIVYADALDTRIGGIAFVNIDSRSISYKGTGGSVPLDTARQDTWEERLEAWREEVHEALREIATGDVRVNLLLTAEEGRPLGILSRLEELKRAH
jgi:probable DNA repair protein